MARWSQLGLDQSRQGRRDAPPQVGQRSDLAWAAILVLLAGWGGGFELKALAGETSDIWRLFGPAQGFPEAPAVALSFSPQGVLWAVHGSGGGISAFDGYSVRRIPSAGPGVYPVKESRTGQVWTMDPDGLREYRRDGWVVQGVAEVQTLRESHPLGVLRALPILPAERNNVLLLLPEVLVRYDTLQQSSTVLRTAQAAGIGEFVDFVESADGSVWVVGQRGVARVLGPVRRMDADTPWEVVLLITDLKLRLTGRAFEGPGGELVVMAEDPEASRLLAMIGNGRVWSESCEVPKGARQAWLGSGGELWAYARGAVFRRDQDQWREAVVEGLAEVQFLDVVVEPSGAFWLATSRGIVRHAGALWQRPTGAELTTVPVGSIAESPEEGVWFGAEDRLISIRDGTWLEVRLADHGVGTTDGRIHRLGSRFIVCEERGRLGVVDARTGEVSVVSPPEGRVARRVLGRRGDGRLVVQLQASGVADGWVLALFDGTRWEPFFDPAADWDLGDDLNEVYLSRQGVLWLGTEMGLGVWNERGEGFGAAAGYPFGPVRSIVEVEGGRLWCATGGAIMEGDGRTWVLLRSFSGAADRLAALRDGSMWALGPTRMFRLVGGGWMVHGPQEGLPESGARDVWMDGRGRVWAATAGGVRRYRPEADTDPPRTEVMSTGGRREFSTTERVTFVLRGQDRWSYAPADQLLYSMRLNEGAWSAYFGGSVLALTNLTAGQQRLEVRGIDPALNEELEPAVFEFATMVPWHAEPRIVAVAMAGLAVALFLAGLALNRHFRLRRSYSEVERMVQERTRELNRANEELVHSHKMRALGTLAAGIAHDFNSILSIIRGSAQIIETNLEDRAKIQTRVDRIKKMVDQGAGIVKAMLGLSRASHLEWRSVDLPVFLEETVRLVADQLPGGLRVHLEAGAEVPRVRMAGDLFRQILFNLILNASEAMGGEGEILLRVRRGEPPGSMVLAPVARGPQVVVEVLDKGPGIDAEILPRIFEPFFTTKAFSTRKGTGLGLTMVHEIARELGVGLEVESALGQGTAFRVYLPLNRPEPSTG